MINYCVNVTLLFLLLTIIFYYSSAFMLTHRRTIWNSVINQKFGTQSIFGSRCTGSSSIVLKSLKNSNFSFMRMNASIPGISTSGISETSKKPLVVIIAGPTGVGKSAVAAEVCKNYDIPGRIVSADSVQAYEGVQIGANKPTDKEKEEVKHYLIDVVPPNGHYTAAEWMRDASSIIGKLTRHDDELSNEQEDVEGNVLPVVVGGTMMYVQWLVHGKPDAPKPSQEAIDQAQNTLSSYQKMEENGWECAINDFTSKFGQAFADRVAKLGSNDWYRLRRTLEVIFTCLKEENVSDRSLDEAIDAVYKGRRFNGLEDLGYDVRCFFLCPHDRMMHTSVVDERCEDMIIQGLIKETADLSLSNALPDEGQPARAIGYRQTLEYLRRSEPKNNDADAFSSYLDSFTTATRQYAKKQMQWFRRDGKFMFIPVNLNLSKEERVTMSSNQVLHMCKLSRSQYDRELISPESLSAKTISKNEQQAKGMKFYIGKRYKIIDGSDVYQRVMAEADHCTFRMQENKS